MVAAGNRARVAEQRAVPVREPPYRVPDRAEPSGAPDDPGRLRRARPGRGRAGAAQSPGRCVPADHRHHDVETEGRAMRASFDATGEVVVITGGAQGIGAALAAAVNAAGGTAVVLDVVAPPDG